jgi:hypothetical protein
VAISQTKVAVAIVVNEESVRYAIVSGDIESFVTFVIYLSSVIVILNHHFGVHTVVVLDI